MNKKQQGRINNRVNNMPVFKDSQPYYQPPRGDSWVSTSQSGTRIGVAGPSGISSRLGGGASGGISSVSGMTVAGGTGTVITYSHGMGGALTPGDSVTVYNSFGVSIGAGTWVAIGWDSVSKCWWVTAADCETT